MGRLLPKKEESKCHYTPTGPGASPARAPSLSAVVRGEGQVWRQPSFSTMSLDHQTNSESKVKLEAIHMSETDLGLVKESWVIYSWWLLGRSILRRQI